MIPLSQKIIPPVLRYFIQSKFQSDISIGVKFKILKLIQNESM